MQLLFPNRSDGRDDTGSLTDMLKARHAQLRGEVADPVVEELTIGTKPLIRAKPRDVM